MEVKWSTEGRGGHWVGLHGGVSREAQCEGISQPALGAGETGNRKRYLLSLSREYVLLLWHQATPGAGEIEQGGFTRWDCS